MPLDLLKSNNDPSLDGGLVRRAEVLLLRLEGGASLQQVRPLNDIVIIA